MSEEVQPSPVGWYTAYVEGKGRVRNGSLLFGKVAGSTGHNTNLPESDWDYLGVYKAHNRELLGLHTSPDTITGEKPDFQLHEVGKFCGLLLKGNPQIIEILFTDRLCWAHEKWKALKDNRKDFLSQRVVKQYLGYAQAQIKRLESGMSIHSKGGKVGEKWAYHMYRLAQDAKRIAEGGEPQVWKDGDERDVLMDIRKGVIPPLEVVRMTKEVIAVIDGLKAWRSDLPEEGNEVFLEDWLLWVRGIELSAPR